MFEVQVYTDKKMKYVQNIFFQYFLKIFLKKTTITVLIIPFLLFCCLFHVHCLLRIVKLWFPIPLLVRSFKIKNYKVLNKFEFLIIFINTLSISFNKNLEMVSQNQII